MERIPSAAFIVDLKVKVCTGAAARAAHLSDHLTLPDFIPLINLVLSVVGIERRKQR